MEDDPVARLATDTNHLEKPSFAIKTKHDILVGTVRQARHGQNGRIPSCQNVGWLDTGMPRIHPCMN